MLEPCYCGMGDYTIIVVRSRNAADSVITLDTAAAVGADIFVMLGAHGIVGGGWVIHGCCGVIIIDGFTGDSTLLAHVHI